MARVPPGDGLVLYLDLATLKQAGFFDLLALSRLADEPEYRAFVEQSGLDPAADLREVLVAFHPEGTFFLLRGRFDWRSLTRFVTNQGGDCHNTFCRVTGSRPDRKISFYPLRQDVMALAVSADGWAAARLQRRWRAAESWVAPQAPVWAWIAPARLASAESLPVGARPFAKALGESQSIVFSVQPSGGGSVEVWLEVTCRSASEAELLRNRLEGFTTALRETTARRKQPPDPRDFSSLLMGGRFEQRGREVRGRWPVGRPFLEALATGGP